MATLSKYLDKRNKAAKRWPLKIRITHKGVPTYISTGYYLKKNEWNAITQRVKSPFKNTKRANAKIDRMSAIIGEVMDKHAITLSLLHIRQLRVLVLTELKKEFSDKFKAEASDLALAKFGADCFLDYAKKVMYNRFQTDRGGSARTIKGMIRSLERFTRRKSIFFSEITPGFLESYERWYLNRSNRRGKCNSINGLGFHLRDIRLIYNLAIADKNIDIEIEAYPFGKAGYKIKVEKTANRNAASWEIAKIFNLQLDTNSSLWHHQNYFKFYFECWGMNFMDLMHLRVSQIERGRLQYRRRKTRNAINTKKFDIELSPTALSIADYYGRRKRNTDFLFPLIDRIEHLRFKDGQLFYKKLGDITNRHGKALRIISKLAGLKRTITTYRARHAFFSIALQRGVSKSMISEMAGHSSFKTTENYLAGFDHKQLSDGANRVRQEVYGQMGVNLLDNVLKLNTGVEMTVKTFLKKHHDSADDFVHSSNLVIAILTETSCRDGIEAQNYVDAFLGH